MNATTVLNQIKALLAGPVTRGVVRNQNVENAFTSAVIGTTGRIYWTRLVEGGKISAAAINVATQSGHLCIAFARNVGAGKQARPGEVIATTGSFECPASTATNMTEGANGDHEQALNVSVTVAAGDWVGIAADNSTVALRCATGSGERDTVLAAGHAYRETIASGAPVIPTKRAALTPSLGKDWLITAQ